MLMSYYLYLFKIVYMKCLLNLKLFKKVCVSCSLVKKFYTAIVFKIHNETPKNYRAKPIINVLDHQPIISNQQFKLWEWIANYYCCSLGDVMHSALPSVLKLSSQTKLKITENEVDKSSLNDKNFSC